MCSIMIKHSQCKNMMTVTEKYPDAVSGADLHSIEELIVHEVVCSPSAL